MHKYIALLGLIGSIYYLGYQVSQQDFFYILMMYALGFAAYYCLYRKRSTLSIQWILSMGILLRLILVFAFPSLSDDIYRFYWDGLLSTHGYNPYSYLPADALQMHIEGLHTDLFNQLNSPNYYTVYPPINQLMFYFGALIFPSSIYGASVVYGLFLLAAEIINFYFMIKLLQYAQLDTKGIILYVFNPLVIVEVVGNLHFESMMLAFFLSAIYFFITRKDLGTSGLFYSAISYTCSIATKLHTVLFVPFIFMSCEMKRSFKYLSVLALLLILVFIPLITARDVLGFVSSLDLYFRKFEFNAGIYYLLRSIGYQIKGYNLIALLGPLLAGVFFIGFLLFVFRAYKKQLAPGTMVFYQYLILVFCVYLFLSTTVHPWYLIIPLGLSVFVNYRFVIVWSFLICLSYSAYSFDPFKESTLFILIEYFLVFGFLYYDITKANINTPEGS